jgi:hypothetical protein
MTQGRHTAWAWAQPDTKVQTGTGLWDVYCAACGRYVLSIGGAAVPDSVACQWCQRTADLARGTLPAQDASAGHKPLP